MQHLFNGYDLTLAVTAKRILLYETHSNEERAALIWKPTQEFFQSLAKQGPKQTIYFFGKQFQFPKKQNCICQNVYAANQANQVAYLGTLFNKYAIYHDRARMKGRSSNALKKIGMEKIVRDRFFCIVPANTKDIDEKSIITAIKKYLKCFSDATLIPLLAESTICLLSAEKGELLNKQIIMEAKRVAKPASKEEKIEKFKEDEIYLMVSFSP